MPRIRQLAQHYASEDFIKEIRKKTVDYNYVSVADVAKTANVTPRTLYRKIDMPETFRIRDLQLIIPILHPDPGIVLSLLGYTKQEIKRFKER